MHGILTIVHCNVKNVIHDIQTVVVVVVVVLVSAVVVAFVVVTANAQYGDQCSL